MRVCITSPLPRTHILGQSNRLLCILQDTIKPGDGVDLCTQGSSLALQLVTHDVDGMCPWTYEHHTSLLQPPCKLHILREKPVPRVDLDEQGRGEASEEWGNILVTNDEE